MQSPRLDDMRRRARKTRDGFYVRSKVDSDFRCNICGALNHLSVDLQKIRMGPSTYERILCAGCGSTMRNRTLMYVFSLYFGGGHSEAEGIGLTDPACIDAFLSQRFNYKNTYYQDDAGDKYLDVQRFSQIYLPDSLDFIISTEVFEHVEDLDKALAECAKVLRPGGRLFVTVPITYRKRHFPLLDERVVESGIRGRTGFIRTAQGKTTRVARRYLGDYFHCGAVTYREMGYEELLGQLMKAGFEVVVYDIDCPQRGIFRVNLPVKKPVIVATKLEQTADSP